MGLGHCLGLSFILNTFFVTTDAFAAGRWGHRRSQQSFPLPPPLAFAAPTLSTAAAAAAGTTATTPATNALMQRSPRRTWAVAATVAEGPRWRSTGQVLFAGLVPQGDFDDHCCDTDTAKVDTARGKDAVVSAEFLKFSKHGRLSVM